DPMLAQPAADGADAVQRLGTPLWVEDKYDGVRCQLHKFDATVRLFSRDRRELTVQFPEVVAAFAPAPGRYVLDGEVLAMEAGRALPFLRLQQRLRPPRPGPGVRGAPPRAPRGVHVPPPPEPAPPPEPPRGRGRAPPAFLGPQRGLGRLERDREVVATPPVALVAFDCLAHEDRALLDEPLRVRRRTLESLPLPPGQPLAPVWAATSVEELDAL